MKDQELFELCKEVYKRFPEWHRTRDKFNKRGEVMIGPFYALRPASTQTPLYTSDYLLEKLPLVQLDHMALDSDDPIRWEATTILFLNRIVNPIAEADTPLKALLKLVIALDDAGVKL